MTTTKPRVFITLPRRHFGELRRLAEKREESLSSMASQLVAAGLESLEDEWLSKISDQRLVNFDMKKSIPFGKVKKQFLRNLRQRGS